MSLKWTIEAIDLLSSPKVNGQDVKEVLVKTGLKDVEVKSVTGPNGKTDFVKVWIPGKEGKRSGGTALTLGIVGRLGGIGARPERLGLVSDADGGIAAVATAMLLGDMYSKGDILKGDVFISTHICPDAPTQPHDPVPFMGSPIDMAMANKEEITGELDAVLSIDTTRGNRVINHRGFAISPTVKEGWILRVSEDLLSIMSYITGKMPVVFPITMQDITPYGNDVYHLNSILQPCTATSAPVVGVALTSEVPVPGCATGATQAMDIDEAVRFSVEVAKYYGEGKVSFYDAAEFDRLISLYGHMRHLQTLGKIK